MESFEISLPDGRKTTGLIFLPPPAQPYPKGRPLIVTVHGGTYSASYYNLDAEHSIANVAKSLNVPVVCVSRPGYGESTPLPQPEEGDSPIRQHGRYLHQVVLPAVWEKYGQAATSTSSIVLQGHSIGAATSIVTAGLFAQDANPKYPLSGLITSGAGCIINPSSIPRSEEYKARGIPTSSDSSIVLAPEMKNRSMINQDMALASDAVYAIHDSINQPMPQAEEYDILISWYEYWDSYAKHVNVAHFTTFPEHDRLCYSTKEHLVVFQEGFTNCPMMDTCFLPGAPHCVELSYMGRAWLTRAFGFAMQCPVAAELAKGRAT